MKVQQKKNKKFPLKLKLTLESVDEAKLLFAVLDCDELRQALEKHGYEFEDWESDEPSIDCFGDTAWSELDLILKEHGVTL